MVVFDVWSLQEKQSPRRSGQDFCEQPNDAMLGQILLRIQDGGGGSNLGRKLSDNCSPVDLGDNLAQASRFRCKIVLP